jgi:hypothetical protein
MNRASRLAASALLLTSGAPCAAQSPRPEELPDPWLVRARAVSNDVAADASSLAPHDRALLWARLGEVWWKDDNRRARELMKKAVEEVESTPEHEEKDARARRLAAARVMLSVVGARDRALGERLVAVLAAKPKSAQATDKEREQNAEALANAGLEVLDADPRRAAELGAASLRAGVSYKLGFLLTRLYKKDADLAVSLFKEGLAAARASHSSELLRVLAAEAFPHRLYFPPTLSPVFPEEVRAATLRLLAEYLLRAPASEEDEKGVCEFAWTAASLVEEFAALLPQQAGAARIVINRCQQKMDANARRHLDDEMAEQKLKTADEYLRAAADTNDERMRNLYLGRAAYVAFSSGEPDRAIEIIEGWDSKLREEMREVWESWRWSFAAASAFKHFKAGDRQAGRRVLDAVPPKLRAAAVIDFLNQLAESKARDFPSEMLGEARLLVTKYEDAETGLRLLLLVRLYAAYLPADGPLVFNEAVAALNRAGRTRPAASAGTPYAWPEYPWKALALPVPLVEADEPGVTSAVASVDDDLTRARMRLGLLKAMLEKRQAELSPTPGRKSGATAGAKPTP